MYLLHNVNIEVRTKAKSSKGDGAKLKGLKHYIYANASQLPVQGIELDALPDATGRAY